LRQALEDRKPLERAKGAVMKRIRLDEDDAFRRLKRLASTSNRKLTELAAEIVQAEQIFHKLENLR
jgi:response regulator NasT